LGSGLAEVDVGFAAGFFCGEAVANYIFLVGV
jgi:hypothetical protein